MERYGTEVLIVDLRDNPGGDSQFVYHIVYALYGWKGVARAAESVQVIRCRPEEHREQYGSLVNNKPMTFERYLDDNTSGSKEHDNCELEVTTPVQDVLSLSETFSEVVNYEIFDRCCEPTRLIVITSAETLSSAFAGAAQLSTLGAEIVGVPPAQSPTSFGEPVEHSLPNTGLTVSISCSAFRWAPKVEGNVLVPDCELTPELFNSYDRAADSALRLGFDYSGITDGNPPSIV